MRQELRLTSSMLLEVEAYREANSVVSFNGAIVLVRQKLERQAEADEEVFLQPEEARRLASMLTAAADFAEGTTAT